MNNHMRDMVSHKPIVLLDGHQRTFERSRRREGGGHRRWTRLSALKGELMWLLLNRKGKKTCSERQDHGVVLVFDGRSLPEKFVWSRRGNDGGRLIFERSRLSPGD